MVRVRMSHRWHGSAMAQRALGMCHLALLAGAALAQPARTQPNPAAVTATATPAATSAAAARDRATCTTLPAAEWLDADEFKLLAAHRGYKTVVFKVTYGACYEIYGYDREGNLVEAYFNPVNAKLVRSNRVQIAR